MALGAALQARANEDPPVDDEGDYENGSFLVEEVGFLLEGSLDVRITGPEYFDAFSAEAGPLDNYPGTLLMEDTPYGDIVVYDTGNLTHPDYILGFPDTGIWAPLIPVGELFVGNYAGFEFEITPTATAQDPQDPQGPTVTGGGRNAGHAGWNYVLFTEHSPGARFRQFAAVTVTWKGVTLGPLPPVVTSGTSTGTARYTSNNGAPMDLSGGTSYVDSNSNSTGANVQAGMDPTNNGDYPAKTTGNKTVTGDAPNTTDPTSIVDDIENANIGTRVTEITIKINFTTYVIKNGAVTSKIQWTAVETISIPCVTPHMPGCDFGGPNVGPGRAPFTADGLPAVTQAAAMDPHHAAAHTAYMGGNFNGAPSQGGY